MPGCWVEELPVVLSGIRTTPNMSMGYTPFFMVYGAEAVVPTDLDHDSPRVVHYTEEANEIACQNGLDLLDEDRELALSRTTIYQQGLRRYHSRRVRNRTFREGDLVLCLVQEGDIATYPATKGRSPRTAHAVLFTVARMQLR
jgi:hypothetical protein